MRAVSTLTVPSCNSGGLTHCVTLAGNLRKQAMRNSYAVLSRNVPRTIVQISIQRPHTEKKTGLAGAATDTPALC